MKRLLIEVIMFVYNGDVNVELWCFDYWCVFDWFGVVLWCEIIVEILEVEGGGEIVVGVVYDENFEGYGLGGEGGCLDDGFYCGCVGVCDRKKRERRKCVYLDGIDVSGCCIMLIFFFFMGNLNV